MNLMSRVSCTIPHITRLLSTNVRSGSMTKIVEVIRTTIGKLDYSQVREACDILENGGVIALPTDTLYGIAARVQDSQAIDRIYSIKGRDTAKPLAVCVASVEAITEIADASTVKQGILEYILPGPVTVLLNRSHDLNPKLNPNVPTVGVRIPDDNLINWITSMVGPLVLTSANRSGEANPIAIEDFRSLWDELDCVLDAGKTQRIAEFMPEASRPKLLGSTVVDMSKPMQYKIVREGMALNRTINLLHRFGYKRIRDDKMLLK